MGKEPPALRLFVAAWPDEAALNAMAPADAWMKGLRATHRPTPRGHRHLTLAFLGNVPAPRAPEVVERLREACYGVGPCEARLRGVVALPRPEEARVIAVALDAPSAVSRLMERVDAAMAGDGAARARPALPHVTIARARGGGRAGAIDLSDAPTLSGVFRAPSVALMRSTLAPSGPVYEEVASIAMDTRE